MAHVFCELYVRLTIVKMTEGLTFKLPISQAQFADVLGLSTVHVNRTLQELRGDDLISWERQVVRIKNWDRLVEAAQFDATYLSMQKEPR
jgi:CRP-like cAMP-binding protein